MKGIIVLLVLLVHAGQEGTDESTRHYEIRYDGVAEITLEAELQEVRLGDPLRVKKALKFLGPTEFVVDQDSLEEGFHISRIDPPHSCGSFGSHVEGYVPSVTRLRRGEIALSVADLRDDHCIIGPGLYRISGSYCHYEAGRVHGRDSASWCVSAKPIEVKLVPK